MNIVSQGALTRSTRLLHIICHTQYTKLIQSHHSSNEYSLELESNPSKFLLLIQLGSQNSPQVELLKMAVAFTGATIRCSSSPGVSTYFFHLTPKCLRKRSPPLQRRRITRDSAAQCMVSNGRASYSVPGDSSSSIGPKMYKRVGSCLVIPPPKGKKPRAIIKFLGGAFIGAVPEVTYR